MAKEIRLRLKSGTREFDNVLITLSWVLTSIVLIPATLR